MEILRPITRWHYGLVRRYFTHVPNDDPKR
jgi:hypothetical protein